MAGRTYFDTKIRQYSPAALVTETVSLFTVKKGDIVTFLAFRKLVLNDGTTPSVTFISDAGAGSATFSAAKNTFGGAVGDDVVANDGASLNQGGFLCTGDGNIQVTFTAGAGVGTVIPVIRVECLILRNRGRL